MFSSYGNYKKVRNAAWQVLIDHNVRELPVPIVRIANESGITLIKNSEVLELRDNEVGISLLDGDNWYIIYDDTTTKGRIRFTIAHELGHIFLGHPITHSAYHARTFESNKPEIETEADSFASRLLTPACVLWGLHVHTAEDIVNLCNVSYTAAKIRAERMQILYERNMFLRNPLEQQVFSQFEEYIENHKQFVF